MAFGPNGTFSTHISMGSGWGLGVTNLPRKKKRIVTDNKFFFFFLKYGNCYLIFSSPKYCYLILTFQILNYFSNQNVISFFFLSYSYIYVIFESSARCSYLCVKRAPHAFSFEKRHKLLVWLFIHKKLKLKSFQFGSSYSIITTINMNLIQWY